MISFVKAYFICSASLLIYILLKERTEFGCKSKFKIEKHCDDLNSVYFNDIIPKESDSKLNLINKL